jgi:hypothetical protein
MIAPSTSTVLARPYRGRRRLLPAPLPVELRQVRRNTNVVR